VASRVCQVLLVHMTRFTYSPTGALKWKKDVSEYAEVLSSYGVPAVDEDMAYMQQVSSCDVPSSGSHNCSSSSTGKVCFARDLMLLQAGTMVHMLQP
jgi:hypothetical protein